MNKPAAYKGFENWWNPLRMTIKMHTHIVMIIAVMHLLVVVAVSIWRDGQAYAIVERYIVQSLLSFSFPDVGYLQKAFSYFAGRALWVAIFAAPLWLFYPFLLGRFKKSDLKMREDEWIRGAKFVEAGGLKKIIKKSKAPTSLKIGDIPVPIAAETKHFFIVGRPGSGKTLCISAILERLKERSAKAVVYDFKGDYLSRFYDPQRDLIFNPLDQRCCGWSVFNEIATEV